jgi:hypothetical protein
MTPCVHKEKNIITTAVRARELAKWVHLRFVAVHPFSQHCGDDDYLHFLPLYKDNTITTVDVNTYAV